MLIHKEYKKKPSLDEIAKAACMSQRHFFRKFREVMDICPIDYVKRVRIEEAKRRLIRSGCSIADVASGAGFKEVSYFHRVFKEVEGISPGAYRKKGLGT
ncbi:MAG: helix-turn-helix transcriptional regulator [Candidatus Latescibacteria bacterium]|nr:helix-turn-helix transcriptional regulator [Candidatus Latescibacterota bacterium]